MTDPSRSIAQYIEDDLLDHIDAATSGDPGDNIEYVDRNNMMAAVEVTLVNGRRFMVEVNEQATSHDDSDQ